MPTQQISGLPSCNIWQQGPGPKTSHSCCAFVQREFVLVKRNSFLYIFRFFLTMFMAVVTATLFLRTQLHPNSLAQGQLYFGVVFFSLIMLMFDGFAEMTFTILRLPGFYKQRGVHALNTNGVGAQCPVWTHHVCGVLSSRCVAALPQLLNNTETKSFTASATQCVLTHLRHIALLPHLCSSAQAVADVTIVPQAILLLQIITSILHGRTSSPPPS